MALQFDPSPYLQAFRYGRDVEEQNRQAPFRSIANLAQTGNQIASDIGQYRQNQMASRQADVDEMTKLVDAGYGPEQAQNIIQWRKTGLMTPPPQPSLSPDQGQALMPQMNPQYAQAGASDTGEGAMMPQTSKPILGSPIVAASPWNTQNQSQQTQQTPQTSFSSMFNKQPIDMSRMNDPNYRMSLGTRGDKVADQLYKEQMLQAQRDAMKAQRDQMQAEKDQKEQDQLEQQYRQVRMRALSSRSGGIGLQDAKVNAAVHARQLIDGATDPKTGEININQITSPELALSLASIVSGGNAPALETMQSMTPQSLQGFIKSKIGYLFGKPVDVLPQAWALKLKDMIDRQGLTSEALRDTYSGQMKSLRPSKLNPETAARMESEPFGTSYSTTFGLSPITLNKAPQNQAQNQPQTVQRKGKDGQIYTYTLNPKTGKYE